MLNKTFIIISLLAVSYLTGCASTPTASGDKNTTGKEAATAVDPALSFGDYQAQGFLTDYAKIPKNEKKDHSYGYTDSTVDLSKYNKLLVDRVKIYFKDDSETKEIDPDKLKALTDYFYNAIKKTVGDAYPMVNEPGPDVLRLRIAITDLVPNSVSASVTSLVVPFLWVADAAGGAATGDAGGSVFTGQATLELEVLDSDSSKQLAAYIDTKTGQKYNYAHGVATGVKGYVNSYSKWAYTQKDMDDWAQMLRVRLDEVHGIAPKK